MATIHAERPSITLSQSDWWREPELQLEKAQYLFKDTPLPMIPNDFIPRTESEVLLLHVPATAKLLWSKVTAPQGYTVDPRVNFSLNSRKLRLAPNKFELTVPTWVAFDPLGLAPKYETTPYGTKIATTEVISALIQFPLWSETWSPTTEEATLSRGAGYPTPSLSGYEIKTKDGWTEVPVLTRRIDTHELALVSKSTSMSQFLSRPTARKVLVS